MARFSRVIPPGGEGWITLRVDTSGYKGNVTKSARVYSNDPTNGITALTIKMEVREFISMSRKKVYLRGTEGNKYSDGVTIKAETEKSLELEPIDFNLEQKIDYNIEEIEKGKQFKVTFINKEGMTGTHSGRLRIKTNYPEKPEIRISVYMSIKNSTENSEKGN